MNPNQVIRRSTYPMKSITPIKKTKVLQTFGNRNNFISLRKQQKPMKQGITTEKSNFF